MSSSAVVGLMAEVLTPAFGRATMSNEERSSTEISSDAMPATPLKSRGSLMGWLMCSEPTMVRKPYSCLTVRSGKTLISGPA